LDKLREYQTKKISNIATDLIGNKVVFFVGAGFSRDLGYPGWGELLKEIIVENDLMEKIKKSSLFYLISQEDHPDYETINQLMLENLIGVDFLRLAGYVDVLLKESGKQDIQSEIKKKIVYYEERRMNYSKKYDEYREAIEKLTHYINEIITTNYDTNLEYCIENISVIHRNLESINNKNYGNLKKNIKLYKIHGCIKDDNNGIIITEKNYQEFNSSNKYIFNKLYSTFMENNIVFIGYSLTDPNIRSLLNEVIDEINNNQLEKKKIYWINRGHINEMDRKFYENIYSMQIIDQIEILDFFNLLITLANTKWNDIEKVESQWNEVADELISKVFHNETEYIDLINKISQSDKLEQILSHLYKNFIVNDAVRTAADNAFFRLLSRANEELITKLEPKVTNILALEDNHLLSILELLRDEESIKSLFVEKKYSKKLLESLISRSESVNDFYLYKCYALALIDYYDIFEGELFDFKDEFIDAFVSNYKYLTNSRTIGYSWESLNEVEKRLVILSQDIIENIVQKYPNTLKSKIQKEQIRALTSHLEPIEKARIQYKYVLEPSLLDKVELGTSRALDEILVKKHKFQFSWRERVNNKIVDTFRRDSILIIFDSIENSYEKYFSIKYGDIEHRIEVGADFSSQKVFLKIDDMEIPILPKDNVVELSKKHIEEKLEKWNIASLVI